MKKILFFLLFAYSLQAQDCPPVECKLISPTINTCDFAKKGYTPVMDFPGQWVKVTRDTKLLSFIKDKCLAEIEIAQNKANQLQKSYDAHNSLMKHLYLVYRQELICVEINQ